MTMKLEDSFSRSVSYLRLSITPACSMRCVYCRPAVETAPRAETILSLGEIESLVDHLVNQWGLRKVRLTGGEPTARPDLLPLIRSLRKINGLGELAMTTNGLTLSRDATALADAGLSRVNISLDTLNRQRFARITGVDGLNRVLTGLDAARKAGLTPIKLNTVVVRGENDDELCDLLRLAADYSAEIRFIELMPMGPLAGQWYERYVPASEMKGRLSEAVDTWRSLTTHGAAARTFDVGLRDGRSARVGFITAMSCPFCNECNRIRIASDGTIFPCLMDHPAGNLLTGLRPRFDARCLDELLHQAMQAKPETHPAQGFAQMTRIGG